MLKFIKRKFTKKEKQSAELRALQITLAVLIGLVLAGVLVLWQTHQDKKQITELRQDAGEAKSEPAAIPPHTAKIGGPFTLINQDGKTVTDADYRGKYLLVYFGYTYCPDMCPTGLQSIAHAMDELGARADKVQPLFITIDPARDTPAKLKEYDASFHPKIVGLTGSAEQIAAVAKAYQVYYAKAEQVDDKDYMMDHSSLIYLMDPEGHFLKTFNEDVDPVTLVKGLQDAWAAKQAPAAL